MHAHSQLDRAAAIMRAALVEGGTIVLGSVDLAEAERAEGDPMTTAGLVDRYRLAPKESRFGDPVDEVGAELPPARCQVRFVVNGEEVESSLPDNQMLVSDLAAGVVKVIMTELVPVAKKLSAIDESVAPVRQIDDVEKLETWLNQTVGLDGVKDTYDDGMPMLVHFYRPPISLAWR